MKIKHHHPFVMFFLLLLFIPGLSLAIFGQQERSIEENRDLKKLPTFSTEVFLDASYQQTLEIALKDQVPFAGEMKAKYNAFKRMAVSASNQIVALRPKQQIKQVNPITATTVGYQSVAEGLESSQLGNIKTIPEINNFLRLLPSQHLLYDYVPSESRKDVIQHKVDNINELVTAYPKLKFHSYYIETEVDLNTTTGENNHGIYNGLAKGLNAAVLRNALPIKTISDYTGNFYKTDHHWNPSGQLKGYQGIIALLGQKPLNQLKIVQNEPLKYVGSKGREISDFNNTDKFGQIVIPQKGLNVIINNSRDPKVTTYGQRDLYLSGKVTDQKGLNHYSECYGKDFGMVRYNNNNPAVKGKTLLVFNESFSNPIKPLIANHYESTYFVDLRHYEKDMGKPFDFSDFVQENPITDVLFMGYLHFYANDVFLVKM